MSLIDLKETPRSGLRTLGNDSQDANLMTGWKSLAVMFKAYFSTSDICILCVELRGRKSFSQYIIPQSSLLLFCSEKNSIGARLATTLFDMANISLWLIESFLQDIYRGCTLLLVAHSESCN